MTGREAGEKLMVRGVLAKDTHGSTVRLSPPPVLEEEDLAWLLVQFRAVITGQ